jgi:hypothetical protein
MRFHAQLAYMRNSHMEYVIPSLLTKYRQIQDSDDPLVPSPIMEQCSYLSIRAVRRIRIYLSIIIPVIKVRVLYLRSGNPNIVDEEDYNILGLGPGLGPGLGLV